MSGFDFTSLLRPELAELAAYTPDLAPYPVRLDANEAPPLLGAKARQRLSELAAEVALERYPDPSAAALRRAIATRLGVDPAEVLVGVGSDEVIALLLTACNVARGRQAPTVLTISPSFVMYRLSARARGLNVVEVPLDAEWDLPVAALRHALELARPQLVFLASPNNPTGTMAMAERLAAVVEAASESLVVIDEAYVDYAARDQLDLYRMHPNVIVLRTLSKIGFAALRVGWLVARPELVAELEKVRLPYNVNALSQRLATAVLDELAADVQAVIAEVRSERERVAAELVELGATVAPREANFVWMRTKRAAGEVYDGLRARGILTRSFHTRGGRLAHQLRVTVGTRAENDRFLAALREVW